MNPIASPKKGKVQLKKAKSPSLNGKARRKNSEDIRVISNALTKAVTGVSSGNRSKMLKKIKKGLAFNSVEILEKGLHVNRKVIASILAIPISTLTRRKKEGRLSVVESDRVVRLALLKDAAVSMMQGDADAAVSWLQMPLEIFDGESPLQHSSTELGARDVEDLIGRIRHGVFS